MPASWIVEALDVIEGICSQPILIIVLMHPLANHSWGADRLRRLSGPAGKAFNPIDVQAPDRQSALMNEPAGMLPTLQASVTLLAHPARY